MQKLATALVLFRSKIESVKKDADNPFFKSKYADLASIIEAIKWPLKDSWLALIHASKSSESGFSLVSTLMESTSWESISSEFPLFWSKPQEVWSSLTYARRYNTLALLDIPTDEDDDGNKSNESVRTQKVVEKPEKLLNFKDLEKLVNSWIDTELLLSGHIKDNEYTLSNNIKKTLRNYCDTGELIEIKQ